MNVIVSAVRESKKIENGQIETSEKSELFGLLDIKEIGEIKENE